MTNTELLEELCHISHLIMYQGCCERNFDALEICIGQNYGAEFIQKVITWKSNV